MVLGGIECYLDLAPADISQTSRFLLEIPFQELEQAHPTEKSYWLLAIKAAHCAGHHVVCRERRRTADSIAIVAAKAAAIAQGLKCCALSHGWLAPVADPTPTAKQALSLDAPSFIPIVNAFSKWRKSD